MANIRVDLNYDIKDGSEIVFRSPVDCSAITGLAVYCTAENGAISAYEFALTDAHGQDVGNIDHLFVEDVIVKVILDVTAGKAYVQNADTNDYIERTFAKVEMVLNALTGHNSSRTAHEDIRKEIQELRDACRHGSGQNVFLFIGPDEPTGENRPLYWLDTSMDDVPVVPEEPDVPVEPEPDEPEPEKTLTGITAVYTGGEVAVGTAVTALTGITVTASYSDGSTEAVTGYTLSGTINEGSNTVTVTYQGQTATFTVTGVAQSGGEELPDVSAFTLDEPWLTAEFALNPNRPGEAQVRAGEAADAIPLTEYFGGDYETLYAVNFRPNATDGYGWASKWFIHCVGVEYNQPAFKKIAEVSASMSSGVDGNRLRWMPLRRADVLAALAATEYTSADVCLIQQQSLNMSKNYNMGIVWMASEPTEAQQRAIIEFFENGGEL